MLPSSLRPRLGSILDPRHRFISHRLQQIAYRHTVLDDSLKDLMRASVPELIGEIEYESHRPLRGQLRRVLLYSIQ